MREAGPSSAARCKSASARDTPGHLGKPSAARLAVVALRAKRRTLARLEILRQLDGFGDLLRCHTLSERGQQWSGEVIALDVCEAKPLVSFHFIFGQTVANAIENAEVALRHSIALLGEPENQFSLTREALSTGGCAKSKSLSVFPG